MQYIVRIKSDPAKRRWKVRSAKSLHCAFDAINSARVLGSIGSKCIINNTYMGGSEELVADVVRINSDGTECRPYTESY